MRLEDIAKLDHINREVDIADEAYCIECGHGGIMKGFDGKRMYFFEGYGPFDNAECFATFIGVTRDKLPTIKRIGRLK